MRSLAIAVGIFVGLMGNPGPARAEQPSCKLCAEQRAACMKNYAGPACKTEYDLCVKSCRK
jgi:hypothetical protein